MNPAKSFTAFACGVALIVTALLFSSCSAPRFSLFPDSTRSLRELTVEGRGTRKVLVIHVRGTIADKPREGIFKQGPSIVEEVVARLKKAEKDRNVAALILAVNSPGGTVTASDMLYHEILEFKKRSAIPVVTILMQTGTSGAYYIALPSDRILAHPTTVTGSVGVILLRPKVTGLAEKIGVEVEVSTSGKLKDLGSPFRKETEEERRIFGEMVDSLGRRFLSLLAEHRGPGEEEMAAIATARVFLGDEALRLGLVDDVGYLDDALAAARDLADLPGDARVVVYRRREGGGDATLYHPSATGGAGVGAELGIPPYLSGLAAGYYYLWLPALGGS